MKRLLITSLALAALAGCSSSPRTPDYECPLNGVAAGKCASVGAAHEASRKVSTGIVDRIQSVFEVRASAPAVQEKPYFNGESSNYPEPSQQGRPVFQQPKVMRVWVAPYVDADGNLRSGEYTYFNTPGKWNYGDMKKPGAASGAFEPGRPSNLGFNPVVKAPPEAKAPPKPTEQPAPAPAATPTANTKPGDPSALAITQPYQRLNTK